VTFPPDKRDRRLIEKLLAELPGILAWFVQGCLRWQRDGLDAPEEVMAATDEYREEMDTIAEFLEECCVQDSRGRATAGALYTAYKKWAEERGEQPLAIKNFGLRIAERGFSKGKHTRTGTPWLGLGLHAAEYDRNDAEDGGL
jgi:putative DNA primase/helicase